MFGCRDGRVSAVRARLLGELLFRAWELEPCGHGRAIGCDEPTDMSMSGFSTSQQTQTKQWNNGRPGREQRHQRGATDPTTGLNRDNGRRARVSDKCKIVGGTMNCDANAMR